MFSQVKSLTIDRLSDGTTAILDNRVKSVHSLNRSATLVWEACANGATMTQIHETVQAKLGYSVEAEMVHQALAQLQRANLIESESPVPEYNVPECNIDQGRRSLLKRAGAIAVPVVLTLTASEQRAYALLAASTTPPLLPD